MRAQQRKIYNNLSKDNQNRVNRIRELRTIGVTTDTSV